MDENESIDHQFDHSLRHVKTQRSERFRRFILRLVTSFRFVRVCTWIVLVFIWACVVYGIENNTNAVYEIGRNASSNATTAPATGIPIGLDFIDALFVSASFWSSTGLSTVDFSLWTFPSQLFCLFGMMFGSLLINTMIPVVVRALLTRKQIGPDVYANPEYRALIMIAVMS